MCKSGNVEALEDIRHLSTLFFNRMTQMGLDDGARKARQGSRAFHGEIAPYSQAGCP